MIQPRPQRTKPEAFYQLPEGVTDEAFDDFANLLDMKYAGVNAFKARLITGYLTITGDPTTEPSPPKPKAKKYCEYCAVKYDNKKWCAGCGAPQKGK